MLVAAVVLLTASELQNSAVGRAGTKAHAATRARVAETRASIIRRRLSSVERKSRLKSRRFPAFDDAVPVLLYHRVRPDARFGAQLQRLHDLGFEAITLDRYIRFVRGEAVDLPQRPILITFDDGYPSALRNADPALARYGWSAVMYVPTGFVGHPGFLSWQELRQMQSSGRWQIDEHAGNGHVLITADASGRRLPFYASELWSDGNQESFSDYKRRVRRDINRGSAALARNLTGWKPHSFAVPFGNYGQKGSNDPRIEPWLRGYLTARFDVVFVQRDDRFTKPRQVFANRIGVPLSWDAHALEEHLLRGLSG